jgi:hypothetical protein
VTNPITVDTILATRPCSDWPAGQWINAAHTRGLLGAAAPTPSTAAPSGKE